jgi:hypothetical protein
LKAAVARWTLVVGFAACHVVMIGIAVAASAESMTNGPLR